MSSEKNVYFGLKDSGFEPNDHSLDNFPYMCIEGCDKVLRDRGVVVKYYWDDEDMSKPVRKEYINIEDF